MLAKVRFGSTAAFGIYRAGRSDRRIERSVPLPPSAMTEVGIQARLSA